MTNADMMAVKQPQPYKDWINNGYEWVPPPRLNPIDPGKRRRRVIIRNPVIYSPPFNGQPDPRTPDPNNPVATLPATTIPANTPTTGTTGTTTADDLIFGFPKMYVYVGGALVAAVVLYYMTAGTGKK